MAIFAQLMTKAKQSHVFTIMDKEEINTNWNNNYINATPMTIGVNLKFYKGEHSDDPFI